MHQFTINQPSEPTRRSPSTSGACTARGVARSLAANGFTIEWGAGRQEAESLVRTVFERAYGARVSAFMPTLMGLRAADRTLMAVCGLRDAATGTLYLERYLDRPIETLLTERGAGIVARQRIIEVGNLAVARPGYAPALIRALTGHLSQGRTEWVVFTAVPALRNAFTKLHIPLLTLNDANPARLTEAERHEWGTYYAGRPQVTAVRVTEAAAALVPADAPLTVAA